MNPPTHKLSIALTAAAVVGTPITTVDALDREGLVVSRVTQQDGRVINQYGRSFSFGIQEGVDCLPIANLPPGAVKVRRRIRATDFARAFIRFSDGSIRQYHLVKPLHDLCVMLSEPIAANTNETPQNVEQKVPV